MKQKGLLVAIAVLAARVAWPGIFYEAEENRIRVTDYPAAVPCTMEKVLSMDKAGGWGKVAYDDKTDTYTVAADLWIGSNDGTETYFQVGSKKHPRETLVMKGNIVVCPYYVQGQNPEDNWSRAPKKVNRLTLGDPEDRTISATLKIDSARGAERSLYVGVGPGEKLGPQYGGQLHVYNSMVTAAVQDADHAFGTPGGSNSTVPQAGNSIIWKNSTLSWARGIALYGAYSSNAVLEDSIFEHCGTVVYNNTQKLAGCTFRNCGRAVVDAGGLAAVLTDCVFEGNDVNWHLAHSAVGLTCVDCTWDTPKKGNYYRCWDSTVSKKRQYPSFTSKRHLIVEVVDSAGKPVASAAVELVCEQGDLSAVEVSKAVTDATGRTPGKGQPKALLVIETVEKATDEENKPDVKKFTFEVKASVAGGPAATVKNVVPDTSWKVVRVTLK